jgi:hypothetical protein
VQQGRRGGGTAVEQDLHLKRFRVSWPIIIHSTNADLLDPKNLLAEAADHVYEDVKTDLITGAQISPAGHRYALQCAAWCSIGRKST